MIYLLRHGEIEQSEEKRFVGQADLPLNHNGLRQAQEWCEKFKTRSFANIYSSDLNRARQTALIITGHHPEEIRFHSDLREINLGEWEGLSVAEVQTRFPAEWEQREKNLVSFRHPGGESFRDLAARVGPVFNQIRQEGKGNILIVAHAGVNRVILCQILGMPLANLFRLGQDYGSLNLLAPDKNFWRVVAMNIPAECPWIEFKG